MASSTKAVILILAIVLLLFVIAVGVLYKLFLPRHLEPDEIISNEPNLTTPLLGPWRNSWTNSWSNSWTNSWGWLRREKHDPLLPTSHHTSKSSLINPPPTTEDIAPSIGVTPAERPLQYTILSGDLARGAPNAGPPHLDRLLSQKTVPWDRQVSASPQHWRLANKPRKSKPSCGRSISPYRPSSNCYHSQPMDFTPKDKRRPRPTFPLPEKLIWKKLTPYERAGMVWYRNAAY
ncbi:hypothetical protein DPV78_002518 [Talaromyces pinophilus]|nr:hypothetical protein DPV78_002518 [Talaromyces pinophilus]